MYRKIEEKILDFINNNVERELNGTHKCLLVDGLRQVGKTYSIRKACGFDSVNLKEVVTKSKFDLLGEVTSLYIALDRTPDIIDVIDGGASPETLLSSLATLSDFRDYDVIPSKNNKVILILDEIQLSKRGVNLLKYLSAIENLIVIASGSMLGIIKNDDGGFPIGYVEILRMYPMDFEEFLLASNYSKSNIDSIINLAKSGAALPDSTHKELTFLFKNYVLIGGLPEYVNKYISLDYDKKDLYLDGLNRLEEYKGDIAKYGNLSTKISGREVFDSVFSNLSNQSTRYFYSSIKKGAKGREYKAPLNWLVDCGLVYQIFNLRNPELPLGLNENREEFKLFYADNLLIYAKSGLSLYDVVIDDLPSIGKGVVYENIAAEILYPLTDGKLYYYTRKSGLEIDFVFEDGKKVCFVEIKSSDNAKSKSLSTLLNDYPDSVGVRCSYRNNGRKNNLFSLPLYLLPFIDRIV